MAQRSGERIAGVDTLLHPRRALVQGVPPLDGIVDNRQVHHADQHQNARRAPGHFTVVKGVPQGDDPGVEKQQHQLRGQARVHTHQVPHIGLPHAAPVTSAMKVYTAPTGAIAATARLAIFICQTSPVNAATAIAA